MLVQCTNKCQKLDKFLYCIKYIKFMYSEKIHYSTGTFLFQLHNLIELEGIILFVQYWWE